jgi:hypothetical protein
VQAAPAAGSAARHNLSAPAPAPGRGRGGGGHRTCQPGGGGSRVCITYV